MLFAKVIATVAAAAAVDAAATYKRANGTDGSVYFCTEDDWTGLCQYDSYVLDTCYDIPGNFSKEVSSFGPNMGVDCLLMQGHCNANEEYYEITYPGNYNLSSINFDNMATSYICLTETTSRAMKTTGRVSIPGLTIA